MNTMVQNSKIYRDPNLVHTDMDGDTVMLDLERGEYFGIGGVGSRVWELLVRPISVEEMAQVICAEYDVDETTCRSDMQAFVAQLVDHGLARIE